jgi:N-acetylglucosaminyl-diphospho-decaprenol L-rhamnosyltransferase
VVSATHLRRSARLYASSVYDVTVAIIHASRLDLTLDCLDSLHADPGRMATVEVVVLDAASGDDFTAVRDRFPDVRAISRDVREGFGANNNEIARTSTSRYVFFLNADTRVPAGTIDALVRYLDAHAEAAVAAPLVRRFDGTHQLSAWPFLSLWGQVRWALTLGQFGAARGADARPVGVVAGCAMLVRRDAFERVDGFDEAYFMYVEETDLARRLDRVGLERHYVPHVEVLHLGGGSTGTGGERQVNEFWRSFDRYLATYHGALEGRALRWVTGLGYALGMVAALAVRCLPPRFRPDAASAADAEAYRLHVRNAFTGRRDPGMRELADETNLRAAGRQSARARR